MKKLSLLLLVPFFVSLFFYSTALQLPSSNSPIIFYSNQNRDDIKRLVCDAIKNAKSSLIIASYHLTDEIITTHLNDLAKQGVQIAIYVDISNKRLPKLLDPRISLHLIKSKGLMHEKILIVDDHLTLLGSANLTYDSLSHHENIMMGIENAELAVRLNEHLEQLNRGEMTPPISLEIQGQHLSLFFCPDFQGEALLQMQRTIEKSEKELFLSIFTLTHPQLLKSIEKVHTAHRNCQIILDRYTARGASKKAKEQLETAHLFPHVSRSLALFHHKWALIDDDTLILGSANWTRGAFEKNADYVLFCHPLTHSQITFFRSLKKRINAQSEKPKQTP